MGLLEALIDRDTLNRMIEAHVELEQQLQQAHRQGWEQAKAEAVAKADELFKYESGYYHYREDVTDAIASMEYKGLEG